MAVSNTIQDAERSTRKQKKWAILGTLIWFGAAIILACFKSGSIASLKLNEIGDFMAGVFAPPAFFWLICGYFMQSRELRLQAEEIVLTRDELKNQVAASAKAAVEAKWANEYELRRNQAQLVLVLEPISGMIMIKNESLDGSMKVAFSLRVVCVLEDGTEEDFAQLGDLWPGAHLQVGSVECSSSIQIETLYSDGLGLFWRLRNRLTLGRDEIPVLTQSHPLELRGKEDDDSGFYQGSIG